MNGFFISISSPNFRQKDKVYKSTLVDEIKDWPVVKAGNLGDVIQMNKDQYLQREAEQLSLPALVSQNDGPLASGKITRFVEIG